MGEVIVCRKCKQEKSRMEFYVDDRYSNGFTPWCKDCSREYTNKWKLTPAGKESRKKSQARQQQRPEIRERKRLYKQGRQGKRAQLRSWLKNLYNLSLEDYERLVEKQRGLCAICYRQNKNGNRLFVDHDHQTGRIRGLLCLKCNTAIGLLDDNVEFIANTLTYLQEK